MTPEFAQRVRELFDRALERPEPERLPFLQGATGGDAALLEAVQRLLRAHSASQTFLETGRQIPAHIGRYLIRRELGRGAMGIVYDAVDPMIGRNVAVKVIHLRTGTDGSEAEFLKERLFKEARSAGQLFHPGIVIILDVGQEGDSAFIAMERVNGPSLQQIIASNRVLNPAEALKILKQTAAALDYAHQHGIVHRDIKPGNIMLQDGVTVKVADFGIAKIMSADQPTLANLVVGTPSYMSPEQIEARPVDGRSDQFSLAVVAYELLTGVRPFEADSVATLAHSIVYGPRPSAQVANPALPPGIDEVFQRGLSKFPGERFASCSELVTALEAAVPDSKPLKPVTRRTAHVWPYVAVATALFVIATLVFLAYRHSQNRPPPKVESRVELPKPRIVQPPSQSEHPAGAAPSIQSAPKPIPASVRAHQLYVEAAAKRREGRRSDAVGLFRQAAELGEAGAMVELAESYRDGNGVPQDETEARKWFQKAAGAGDSSAMVFLGAMYLLGDGVDASDEEAVRWFQKAAERGNAAGIYDLGTMYEDGRGVPENLDKAKQLYQRSATLGNNEAQKRLAELASRK